VGDEGGQVFMSFLDSNLVIAGLHIEFGEDFGSSDLVHDLVNVGEGVGVSDGDVVQPSIVNAGTFVSVLLLHKEDWCC
jgi:hypothetical protein